jgi:hypothetical protein
MSLQVAKLFNPKSLRLYLQSSLEMSKLLLKFRIGKKRFEQILSFDILFMKKIHLKKLCNKAKNTTTIQKVKKAKKRLA